MYPTMVALAIFYIQFTYYNLFLTTYNNNNNVLYTSRRYSRQSLVDIKNVFPPPVPPFPVLNVLKRNRILIPICPRHTTPTPGHRSKHKRPRGRRGGLKNRRQRIDTIVNVFLRPNVMSPCDQPADRDPLPAPPLPGLTQQRQIRQLPHDQVYQ